MPGPGPPGPPEESRDVTLVVFGICLWDYLTSLWFEYRLISKKIRFRWQFVPYFFARYLVLTLATLSVAGLFTMHPPCSYAALSHGMLYLGLLAMVFSTWNLLTRTAIIWGYHPLLMKSAYVVGLTHFALAFIAGSVGRTSCEGGPPSVFNVMIFACTTAVIEFVVLLASLVGIKRVCTSGESRLARLLVTQGIAYFVAVFCIQISTIVVTLAHTSGPTRTWVGVSGAIFTSILSCRLVTSTISQSNHEDHSPQSRTRRLECFELSEDQSRTPSAGRITTCIDIDTTKDQSLC